MRLYLVCKLGSLIALGHHEVFSKQKLTELEDTLRKLRRLRVDKCTMARYVAMAAHFRVELYIFEKIREIENAAMKHDCLIHLRDMISNLL